MREQPHHVDLLTKEFFQKHYVEERMSYPKIREMLLKQGHNIHVGTLHKYAKQHGVGRSRSEAKRERDPNPLDYNISYLSEPMIEAIDGFLLGDGNLNKSTGQTQTSRLQCHLEHEEFCDFMMRPFDAYAASVNQYKSAAMKSGACWHGRTKFHPDLYGQYQRWYPTLDDEPFKTPPQDVRITPISVMLWFLGDGSTVQSGDSISVRLSTDYFPDSSVEMLVEKLKVVGILCHRNNDNRIYIEARGIPAFFDFIGKKSPVKCYDYKFELPEWRFTAKRLREVTDELGVSYNRLSHLVKTGRIGCYRASSKGRPRMLPEHIEQAKDLKKTGVLY